MDRETIRQHTLAQETELVASMARIAGLDQAQRRAISDHAATLVRNVREQGKVGAMESLLAEYGLSTDEGVALMCLAEAMLRVPDSDTVDELIRDKITPHDWAAHVGDSGSILVNASTWALMLTGRILDDEGVGVVGTLHALVRRVGEPVIRKAVGQAMAEMGSQFVLGESIHDAIKNGAEFIDNGYTYSYDMLGEAARTEADASRYHASYLAAIEAIAQNAKSNDIRDNPGISVKLSALHPRYEMAQAKTMLPQMAERLLSLAKAAANAGIGLNVDAEEADRLDLSLDVIETVLAAPELSDWAGFGVVVQAFGRRAIPVIDHLYGVAMRLDRRIMVRLVKGAYWDMEIKRAQVLGLKDYSVFTRKAHTDISYLACAHKLLGMTDRIYPQFATHNAHSVAAILNMARDDRSSFEFQRLHGMGNALHDLMRTTENSRCRIYAPVGAHKDLLAYLVRRLLENGANSSFVNQIVDLSVPAEDIAADPIAEAEAFGFRPNPAIPMPSEIFAPRRNSQGWDLSDPVDLALIDAGRSKFVAPYQWQARPVSPVAGNGVARQICNPAELSDVVGVVKEADAELAELAVDTAIQSQPGWDALGADNRADILRRIANIYEANATELFALLARESGKTLLDAVAELREAVDFLRYYADQAELIGANGKARGVIICISPWNFPIAIFTGQIAAALAAGNAVIAKPAEQTPLIAAQAVAWMRGAGVPEGVIQLLPGDGVTVGAPLTADPRIGGVCFTGSTEVAKIIDQQLARTAPAAMFIAETGGLNAMVVDSTALLEQATRDIVRAAFQSAGQRCSALRVLYVQKDVEADLIEMLSGAMDTLVSDAPWDLATDVGPVIDADAQADISAYLKKVSDEGRVIKQLPVPKEGHFIPPTIVRVSGIAEVDREIFGPVLHLASFEGGEIDTVIGAINTKGYGLTFGLHSRIDMRVQDILDQVQVGNAYVNRDQIGAVVGSQPFGGHGLSGTGPKAGGPNYLPRFRTFDDGTTAVIPLGQVSKNEIEAALRSIADIPVMASGERIATLRSALRGRASDAMSAAAAIDVGPLDLPGPTGESNQFELISRGNVLCLGPDPETLLAQSVQALAAGNRVVSVGGGSQTKLRFLLRAGLPIVAIDGTIEPSVALAAPQIDLVAVRGNTNTLRSIRVALAEREGPIVPVITERITATAYYNERTICIDTTAAGGNASLLAEAECAQD